MDVSAFASGAEPAASGRLLFVGTWSYQKGSDVLARAVEASAGAVSLIHVGAVGDLPLPSAPWFKSLGRVDQHALPAIYRRAAVLVLPSRQDGFGMVIPQALAAGLRAICSDHTGGADLRWLSPELGRRVTVVPAGEVEPLRAAIAAAVAGPRASR